MAIDELRKDAIKIDATGNEVVDNTEPEEKINIAAGRHTIVDRKPTANQPNTSERVEFDLSSVPEKEETEIPGVDIRESLAKDILVGENSPFEKYKREKMEEYKERMATYDDEMAMKEEEEELESGKEDMDELSFSDSNDIDDSDNEPLNMNNASIEEEDISALKEEIDEEEENKEIMQNEVTHEIDGVEESNTIVEEGTPVGKGKENKKEETVIEKPDIDVEVDTNEDSKEISLVDEEEETQEDDAEEKLKYLRRLATERLKPVSKTLDISSFTVLKKPTANTAVLNQVQTKVAKWTLLDQESIVFMKEFTGAELEALREYSEDQTSVASLTRRFRMIYDHITSPKPASFEVWLKSTPYADVDNYFFAIYIASFKGANYLPMDCVDPKCGETFLTEDIDIMDMVKFRTEEAKKKFVQLYTSESAPAGKGIYCTEIVPLSHNIAVQFKEPSIYSYFEVASIDQKFKEKYASVFEYIPYIDSIYLIDENAGTLTPVGYKVYSDNVTKSIKSKIKKFADVLSTLSIDEFGPIKAYISGINERKIDMDYVYPSVTCPKCGKETKEQISSAEELVFIRYQLGALVNTSLK